MVWSALGTQFALELALGVLIAMAFVPNAPVGPFFYRIMGTAALVPILLALALPMLGQGHSAGRPQLVVTALAVLAYPVFSGPVRGRGWAAAQGLGVVAVAVALALQVRTNLGPGADWGAWSLASFSAVATGCVTGSVGLAMVLGHWYLTVPTLQVRHLRRLNRVCVASMLACLCAIALSCVVFADDFAASERSLFGMWGLFYLSTRVAVGLLVPLLFAWMTAQSLDAKNTRSATGILYASTVLVMIGAAASISLQDSFGVPL